VFSFGGNMIAVKEISFDSMNISIILALRFFIDTCEKKPQDIAKAMGLTPSSFSRTVNSNVILSLVK
jgi:DNA-binding MarR family transcriptional regulator